MQDHFLKFDGTSKRQERGPVPEQLIAEILAIKLRQDRAAEAAIRERAEKAHAQEAIKRIAGERWNTIKAELLDSAAALNTALKPGQIEISMEDGQTGTTMMDFMRIRVTRDGREAGTASLNVDNLGGVQLAATIKGARRHEPWERKIAAEQVGLETLLQAVLDFVKTIIEKGGR
jgi:hypothetical protein